MSKLSKFIFGVIFLTLVSSVFFSCVDEGEYASGDGVSLSFDNDTLSFDTIFTTFGSVTKKLMVYNNESKPLKIDYVKLKNGASSFFRLNVDASTDLVVRDVEIGAKDSLYIFVRVELNPNDQSNPLLVEDEIIFGFNGKTQRVLLHAYGQDVYYHEPKHYLLSENPASSSGYDTIWYSLAEEGGDRSGCLVNGNEITWKNDKPHVILGTCVVDSAYTLNLTSGTRLCFDKESEFWVYKDGTLNAVGETSMPIRFESMRNDEHYASTAGQWGCVRFIAGSKDNVLDNVIIKNNIIGVLVDTCVNQSPTISMKNTRIENCSYIGVYSRGARIEGQNVIVQNCGNYTLALTMGGSYEFVHCTFANYWRYATRTKACLLLNDYYVDVNYNVQYRPVDKADFYNCIVYGSLAEEEIELDLLEGGISRYRFENCVLKSKDKSLDGNFVSCIFADPLFKDPAEGDLRVGVSSPAIGAGNGAWSYGVPFDINGVYRPDPPTIGALEYVEDSERGAKRAFQIR